MFLGRVDWIPGWMKARGVSWKEFKKKKKVGSFLYFDNSPLSPLAPDHSLFEIIVTATGYESALDSICYENVYWVCACFLVRGYNSNSLLVTATEVFAPRFLELELELELPTCSAIVSRCRRGEGEHQFVYSSGVNMKKLTYVERVLQFTASYLQSLIHKRL